MIYGKLYDDISYTYIDLVTSDINTLIDGLNADKAHRPQFEFRFNLFLKNIDSLESLFTETSTVENAGRYTDFRLALKKFVDVMKVVANKPKVSRDDLYHLHEMAFLLDDLKDDL